MNYQQCFKTENHSGWTTLGNVCGTKSRKTNNNIEIYVPLCYTYSICTNNLAKLVTMNRS